MVSLSWKENTTFIATPSSPVKVKLIGCEVAIGEVLTKVTGVMVS